MGENQDRNISPQEQEPMSAMERKYAEWDARAKAEQGKPSTKKGNGILLIAAIVATAILIYHLIVVKTVSGSDTGSLDALGRSIGSSIALGIMRPFLISLGLGGVVSFYAWFANNKTATIISIGLYALGAVLVSRFWFEAAIPIVLSVFGLVRQMNEPINNLRE